ncbi:uncharacterized protein LOC112574707 [Pomacea canaliculata]|uniref:uncharacterized protein LOC112574707 n=1 Tax=Pomacea canaliculata TaxID=400727 RepID=UPI000D73F6A4|nr:uncharacterized protein LOC112574707 [Pomacea canaliculata]
MSQPPPLSSLQGERRKRTGDRRRSSGGGGRVKVNLHAVTDAQAKLLRRNTLLLGEIRRKSGARVDFDRNPSPLPGMKIVIIRGAPSQIVEAIRLIHQTTGAQEDIYSNIRKKLRDAVSQLDKAEAMLSHLVSDIAPGLRITKTIAFPNLTARQLQQAISHDSQLTETLCRCLGTTSDPSDIPGVCLCFDQLSHPKTPCDVSSHVLRELGQWWQRHYEVDDDTDLNKAVNDLSQAARGGPLYVIADEAVSKYSCSRKFLVSIFGRQVVTMETHPSAENITPTSTAVTSTSGSTTPPCLQWKDVFVLYWYEGSENTGMVNKLQEAGIPVRVMKDDDIDDVATASSDVVWVAGGHRVRGLERKVVVCLGDPAFDSFRSERERHTPELLHYNPGSARLDLMSRCTSQLVIISAHH